MSASDEIICSIWLSLALGAGSGASEALYARFGYDAETVWRAERESLAAIPELDDKKLTRLTNKSLDTAKSIYEFCLRENIGLLPVSSPVFPERLRSIRSCPALLYYKGKLPDIDSSVLIATVGTRRMTEYGKRCAYALSYDLARAGAIVVSGMALGIDSVCHRGSLDAGGHTIAILGCGIDRCYPAQNRELMDEIILHGTVMTEFAPGTPPTGSNFPIRNRIISGLSLGALVLEADDRSGAMITAHTAIMQGRDIFSLPGKIGEQNSLGTNRLIKEGAKIITCAADVLDEYQNLYPSSLKIGRLFSGSSAYSGPRSAPRKPASVSNAPTRRIECAPVIEPDKTYLAPTPVSPIPKKPVAITDEQSRLYEALAASGKTSDELAVRFSLPVGEVLATLTMLEIKGVVRALPGGMYVRAD